MVADRQRFFGRAEGHAFMSSVWVELYGVDHDLLDASSLENPST
jgi:hypothetical protein